VWQSWIQSTNDQRVSVTPADEGLLTPLNPAFDQSSDIDMVTQSLSGPGQIKFHQYVPDQSKLSLGTAAGGVAASRSDFRSLSRSKSEASHDTKNTDFNQIFEIAYSKLI
jgi:hypothetical protein